MSKPGKPKKVAKERLDTLVAERGLVASRELARRLIMEGQVTVNGQVADKPGTQVAIDVPIELRALPRFVSRGGDKLDAALLAFDIDVTDLICADVGASTGGFTDCLRQHGAALVYAIDVGYGQLDYRLRKDSRVVVMERTNARHLVSLPERVHLIAIDASFISLKLLLPVVIPWSSPGGQIVALIKPQFEAGRGKVGKGGVVREQNVHYEVLLDVFRAAQSLGLVAMGLIRSPLKGPAGNVEFLAYWRIAEPGENLDFDLETAIGSVLSAPETE